MRQLIQTYLNSTTAGYIKTSYQLVFLNLENIDAGVMYDNYHVFDIDSSSKSILPNSLRFGIDLTNIPTDNPQYVDDVLSDLIDMKLINNYTYNKVILDDPYRPLSDIYKEITDRVHGLGYPKHLLIYKYMNGVIIGSTQYELHTDFYHQVDELGVNIVRADIYIQPEDKLSFYYSYR